MLIHVYFLTLLQLGYKDTLTLIVFRTSISCCSLSVICWSLFGSSIYVIGETKKQSGPSVLAVLMALQRKCETVTNKKVCEIFNSLKSCYGGSDYCEQYVISFLKLW